MLLLIVLNKMLAVMDRIKYPASAPVCLLSRLIPVTPGSPQWPTRVSLVVWVYFHPVVIIAATKWAVLADTLAAMLKTYIVSGLQIF